MPVAVMVTVVPTDPLVGLKLIAETTVNNIETELELASVKMNDLLPEVEAGTVNVMPEGMLPDVSVV
jgi:hypothetical protein